MAEDEHVITVGSYEHRLMIAGLNGGAASAEGDPSSHQAAETQG